jgi:hypothetical protein
VSPGSLLRALAISTLSFLVVRIAHAELPIALVEPGRAHSSEAERRAFVQLRAELDSDGYVVLVVMDEGFESGPELESVAREASAPAAIRVRSDRTGLLAEIWTQPQPGEPGELATARAEGQNLEASRTLALRTVEILRGRGLSSIEQEEPLPPPREHRFGGGLSLEVLGHPSGLPTTIATMVTLGYRVHALRFELRALSAAEARLREPEGQASFDQALVLGSLRIDPLFGGRVSPFLGFSGGAYALAGESKTLRGLIGHRELVWTAAFGPLAGASFGVYEGDTLNIELVARFDALWLSPQPVVRFVERPVARAGQPLLMGGFGAEVLF